MIETIILCALYGIFILLSFVLGLNYGVKLRNNEPIDVPNLNPVKAVKNAVKEAKEEHTKNIERTINEINTFNIDNYDGTGLGQKDFPR
jgi:hypothetical protein